MTEKEKREKGLIYNPNYDAELRGEMVKAQDLCYEYNNIKPSETTARIEKINQILGKIGKNCLIEQPFICDYGYNIEVGDNFYANHNLIILDAAKVIIGDNATIGAGSIVTKDIPANSIAYGNPCKVAKKFKSDNLGIAPNLSRKVK